jgi:ribosomal protein S18 acetylase RimI-like enzyme
MSKIMSAPFTLVPAGDNSYDAVFALHERLFRPHIEQIWGWLEDWQRENFLSNWKDCDTRVVESCGELVGYIQTLRQPDHLLLKNLGLAPSHQGQGIGAALIQGLQAEATALGLRLRLSVFTTNPRAERFYQRAGFINEGRTSAFQHMSWHS